MAEARVEKDWAIASHQMALLANCHRDAKKSKAFQPSDFNPYARPTRRKPDMIVSMGEVKDLFRQMGVVQKERRKPPASPGPSGDTPSP